MSVIGIDASKAELALSVEDGRARLKNQPLEIEKWAKSLPADTVVGVEATGRYHRPVLEALHHARIKTYLLNPLYVSRYIKMVKPSVKNDRIDSMMIARYLEREQDMLIPYKMPAKDLQELKDLLSYRETLTDKRTAIRQSLSEQTFLLKSKETLDKGFQEMVDEVDSRIKELALAHHLYKRMLVIDGVGPMGASALTWLFATHDFVSSDQAVSFVGLDVSVRRSGQYVGKSKLTKRGPAFVRTFLHNGANSLRAIKELKPLFEHHEAKGLSTTEVNIIVARKLVRIAFALATKPEAVYKRENLLPRVDKKP